MAASKTLGQQGWAWEERGIEEGVEDGRLLSAMASTFFGLSTPLQKNKILSSTLVYVNLLINYVHVLLVIAH